MSRKKVLVITYYWPPAAGPGVQRFLKFCKYLPGFGWDPVVLTVGGGSYSSKDATLGEDIIPETVVYRTRTFEPFSVYNTLRGVKGKTVPVSLMDIKEDKRLVQRLSLYLRANYFIPDARKGWKRFALKEVMKIMKAHDLDAIITTGPPQSTHLIGMELKLKYNIPWVADFRDPWTTVYYNKFFPRSAATKRSDKLLEDKVLQSADAVVTVGRLLGEEFRDRARSLAVIYNGYDQEDFPVAEHGQTEHFTLEYIGNLKPNQHPAALWTAIRELIDEDTVFAEHFRLHLTGNIDKFIAEDLKLKYQFGSCLTITPYVSHKEAVARMVKTNLLLFIVPEAENNKLIITGKLFEYLASRTPILSIGPVDGDASSLLKEAGRDAMVDYASRKEMKEQLLDHFGKWKQANKVNELCAEGDLLCFSRKELTHKLSKVLNSITK